MNIYVGNLNFNTTENTLRATFAQYGPVKNVTIITDRETGQPRGFGFVLMQNQRDGERAVHELDRRELDGRTLKVNEARKRH